MVFIIIIPSLGLAGVLLEFLGIKFIHDVSVGRFLSVVTPGVSQGKLDLWSGANTDRPT